MNQHRVYVGHTDVNKARLVLLFFYGRRLRRVGCAELMTVLAGCKKSVDSVSFLDEINHTLGG